MTNIISTKSDHIMNMDVLVWDISASDFMAKICDADLRFISVDMANDHKFNIKAVVEDMNFEQYKKKLISFDRTWGLEK